MNKRINGRAIVIEGDDVLLMFRRKITNGIVNEYYAIPGGGVEEGETLKQATIRELKEELSIDIEIISYLGKLEEEKCIHHIFNAKKVSGDIKLGGEELEQNNDNNYYEVRKIKLNEIDKINLFKENKEFIKKAQLEREKEND